MNAQLDVQRLADILLACWVVAHGSSEPLPLASGTLDISLKRAIERGAFPPEFRSLFRIGNGSQGMKKPARGGLIH
jgi:hypothetical protein